MLTSVHHFPGGEQTISYLHCPCHFGGSCCVWCLHQIRYKSRRQKGWDPGSQVISQSGPHNINVEMRLSLLSARKQKNNCLILNEKHDFLIIVNGGRGGKKESRQRIRSFICNNLVKALPSQRAGSSGADGKEAEAVHPAFWRRKLLRRMKLRVHCRLRAAGLHRLCLYCAPA